MWLAILMLIPFIILTFFQLTSKKPGNTWRRKLGRILLMIPVCIAFPFGIVLAIMVIIKSLNGQLDYTSQQEQSNITSFATQISNAMKSNPDVDINEVKDLLKSKLAKPKKPKKPKPVKSVNRFEMMDIDK